MTSKKQQQAEGNILTFLRIRPSKKSSGFISPDVLDPDTLTFSLPDNFKSDYVNNSKLHHEFHFNGILPMEATQEDVFNKVGAAAVKNALEGFNSTIFAYGQTGSGKTFTITGGPDSYQDRGIIPRAISMIFKEYRTKTDVQIKAFISYLELYNEQGYDLLEPSLSQAKSFSSVEELPKVSILEDGDGNFHLRNLSMHIADSEEDALNLLFMGDTNRAIAETAMNKASSRSHCIFTISMEIRQVGSDSVRYSKLHLVDLAGSERVAKTNSSGSVLTEAKYINTSLFFLEMVIVALYEKATKGRQHVPYRNSLMTSVLRDSLGGNCKTIMIATVNPEASHTDESLSTCRFAQRVSLIKNKAVLNEDLDPTAVIRRLKDEILSLREEIAFLKGEAGEGDVPTPQELADLQQKCRVYCDDTSPTAALNIGTLTLTKIKDAFAIFKNLVLEARASGGSGVGVGGGGEGQGATSEAETEDLKKQIRDLKSCLVQRDTEIAILVNMVKKSKSEAAEANSSPSGALGAGTGAGYASRGNRSSRGSDDGDGLGFPRESPRGPQRQQVSVIAERDRDQPGRKEPDLSTISMARVAPDRLALKEERLIKRHLFGVPPPDSLDVLEDPAAAFEYFRTRIDSYTAIEENKELLRLKYADAKTLGERANNSRNTITYLKTSIESLRRERALQGLESKTTGDGEGEGAGGEEESEEELTYRRAIEQEKEVYKESFEKLRQVKPEIEHIRKILEKSRANLQSQFDQWYNNLTTKMTVVEKPGTHTQQQPQPRGQQDYAASRQPSVSASVDSQLAVSGNRGDTKRAWGTPETSPVPVTEARPLRLQSQSQSQELPRHVAPGGGVSVGVGAAAGGAGGGGGGGLPPLTGNKEADEDIMAFYKAKEELLKRRATAQQQQGGAFPPNSER